MELKFILEAVLFQAQKPMSPDELRELLRTTADRAEETAAHPYKRVKTLEIESALVTLAGEIEASQRSYQLLCVAGAWQFVSRPDYAPWLRVLLGEKPRPPRLSQPGLETLAIVAYRQPITRAEIEQIRGVSVDGVMQTLLERGLIAAVGRAEAVGRPITYGTTSFFLEYFGLGQLEDLPAAEELRRVEVHKPEALQTVEPGLATVPPESLSQMPEASPEPPWPAPNASAPPASPSNPDAIAGTSAEAPPSSPVLP
jgi:segregation and condensation protein B